MKSGNTVSASPTGDIWRRAFQCAVILTLSALLLAGVLLSVVNDMYAFVKPNEWVELTVSDPLALSDFSLLLERYGILNNPHIFSLYAKRKRLQKTVEQ